MASKHTPGPWLLERAGENLLGSSIGHLIATVEGTSTFYVGKSADLGPISEEATEANARLIAAAPELLAGCQAILRAPSPGSGGPGSITLEFQTFRHREIAAAVARATGQPAPRSVDRKYPVGFRFACPGDQHDDDENGEDRVTLAGMMLEIVAHVPENTKNVYAVECPHNGAQFFFSDEEIDQCVKEKS